MKPDPRLAFRGRWQGTRLDSEISGLAADGNINRVSLKSERPPQTIEMREGLVAGSVGLDEPADVVWVSTCVPAEAQFPDRTDPCRVPPGS